MRIIALLLTLLLSATARAGEGDLVLRRVGGPDTGRRVLPSLAVRAFPWEGEPVGLYRAGDEIAVRYDHSLVFFERETGRAVRREILFSREPAEELAPIPAPWDPDLLVGPGVLHRWGADEDGDVAVASATFGGRRWEARQPARFLRNVRPTLGREISWTRILEELGGRARLVASAGAGGGREYGKSDGLPGEIVTHLAVAGGSLWAACADVHDPDAGEWGDGGLARYDAEADRFVAVETIDGRPARFVTALAAAGEDLWVGFREGTGVVGDSVAFGMGVSVGNYRPETSAIVVARLSGGEWRCWARPPLPIVSRRVPAGSAPPTEAPRALAGSGGRVAVFTTTEGYVVPSWEIERDGRVWLLDPERGGPAAWEAIEDPGDLRLLAMHAGDGEVLVRGMRGAYRLDPRGRLVLLDPASALRSPEPSAAAVTEDAFWFGMTNRAFGVVGRQGVYRWDESESEGKWFPPEEIGTASPVARLFADGEGTVWARFAPRGWFGAAVEFRKYDEGLGPVRSGVGRWREGSWEFPLTDFPETLDAPAPRPAPTDPPPERRPGAGKAGLDRWLAPRPWRGEWVRLPGVGGGDWAIGPVDGQEHWVVPTPHAIWLLSRGLVIRLDRVWLEALLDEDETPAEATILRDPADLDRARELLARQDHDSDSSEELLRLVRPDPEAVERAAVRLVARPADPESLLRALTLIRLTGLMDEAKFTRPWWRRKALLVHAYRVYADTFDEPAARKNARQLRDTLRKLGVLWSPLANPFPK